MRSSRELMIGKPNQVNIDTRKRVLILYDQHEVLAKTTLDYLASFYHYSRYQISYVSSYAKCRFDLDYFDVVVLHYTVRICIAGRISTSFMNALRSYRGLKALFIQDEY